MKKSKKKFKNTQKQINIETHNVLKSMDTAKQFSQEEFITTQTQETRNNKNLKFKKSPTLHLKEPGKKKKKKNKAQSQ